MFAIRWNNNETFVTFSSGTEIVLLEIFFYIDFDEKFRNIVTNLSLF